MVFTPIVASESIAGRLLLWNTCFYGQACSIVYRHEASETTAIVRIFRLHQVPPPPTFSCGCWSLR